MQTKKNNQQHIIIRARCTGQFIVYLATWTFQSIQNYLYKLSGKRLSGKMIVRETSCTGNKRRVVVTHAVVRETSFRETSCPGKWLSGKRLVRETFCPGIVLSGKGLVREMSCPGNVLSGKRLVRETSVRESDCPGNVRYPTEVPFYTSSTLHRSYTCTNMHKLGTICEDW